MNKPRVLIIENSTAVTGALISILRSSAGLKDKYDFSFVLPKNSKAIARVVQSGFDVHEFPMVEIRRNVLSLLLYIPFLLANTFRLSRLVRSEKISLITVNDFYNLLPWCYHYFGGKIPHICYVRFMPSKFPPPLMHTWFSAHDRYAASIVAVSEAVRKELPPSTKIEVIGNELPEKETPYTDTLSKTILYPANYIRGKGQEYALQSFALISDTYPDWKLRFVGGTMGLEKNERFKSQLTLIADNLGLTGRVEWGEFAAEISKEYTAAAFALNFSESESFSMTCLEAMYFGRPLVATRCGGPSEIIDHQRTGILVDLFDVKEMASAMEYLISTPDKRAEMARNAYLSVRERFSHKNTIEKLGQVYHSALLK